MSHRLIHLIIRMAKENAAFTYFQFESNEGLCFYSTLESSLKGPFRDIEIFGPAALELELRHLLSSLSSLYPIEYLKDEVIDDKEGIAGGEIRD